MCLHCGQRRSKQFAEESVSIGRIAVLLVFCGLGGLAHAQQSGGSSRPQPPTGSNPPNTGEQLSDVGGRVLYANRLQPAVRIQVNLLRNGAVPAGVTYTNSQGEFEFPNLTRTFYTIEVAVERYEAVRERVDLYFASRQYVTILLEPKLEVEATGKSPAKPLSVRELRIPDKARKSFEKGMRELYENGRPDRSLGYLRQAIDIYPEYDEAYLQLSLAHLQQGQYAEAQAVIEKATAINPANARAYMALGTLQTQQGRSQDALRSLQRALELDPQAWQVHYELGKSLLQQGKTEEAYEHARRALQLNGQGPALHLFVYNLCIRRGDYQAALAELDEFVKLYPAHPAVSKLLEKREGLRQAVAAAVN